MKDEIDNRKNLYSDERLSGGTTMLIGIGEGMTRALTAPAPSTMNLKLSHHQSTVLRLDRRFHPVILEHLPAKVDL